MIASTPPTWASTASWTSFGSSRRICRLATTWPAPSSSSTIVRPLTSVSSARVSLIVSTAHRTPVTAAFRCSDTLTCLYYDHRHAASRTGRRSVPLRSVRPLGLEAGCRRPAAGCRRLGLDDVEEDDARRQGRAAARLFAVVGIHQQRLAAIRRPGQDRGR